MNAPMPAAWGQKKSRKLLKKARKVARAILPVGGKNRPKVRRNPKGFAYGKNLKVRKQVLAWPSGPYGNGGLQGVKVPAARNTNISIGAPQFNSGGAFVVRHREYLQQIVATTAFSGTGRYIIQAGLVDNFPWLAQIAGSFETYCFKSLKYIFRAGCGSNTAASIYTATQYDPVDPEFASVDNIMTYAGARKSVPWNDFAIDCKLRGGKILGGKYFVRTDVLPSGQDPQTYDMGLFTISAVGVNNALMGDLLVEYECHLYTPKTNPQIGLSMGYSTFFSVPTGTAWAASPFANAASTATSNFSVEAQPVIGTGSGIGDVVLNAPGVYDISYQAKSAVGSTFTVASIAWAAIDAASCILTVQDSLKKYQLTPAQDFSYTSIIKVLSLTANCVLRLTITSPGGTTSFLNSTLTVVSEPLNWFLAWLGQSPNPPLATLSGLKLAKSRHKTNVFDDLIHNSEKIRVLSERKLEIKDSPSEEVVVSNQHDENPVSDSDGFEEVRSLSRDPKKKKSKKSDLKSREA